MRHGKSNRKFHRVRGKRRAFMKGLISNLILRGRIETTEARAKELRPAIEKLVTIARKQNLAALRLLCSRIPKKAAYKLYHDISTKYSERNGGYTRIKKTAKTRKRDAAKIAIIEFV